MNPTRRCSALLSQLCVSSLGGPTTRRAFTPAAVSAPAGARRCETGVRGGRGGGANGTGAQLKPSGASTPGAVAGTVHRSVSSSMTHSDNMVLTTLISR